MDLRHLETFVKIAELKSFTKAAEELFLTQPTVSKQIVDLERYFGVKLIDRTKRTVVLTRAGEILLRYAKDFLGLKKETIDAIAAFKGLQKGDITVGASNIPGVYILPGLLNIFKQLYNGIRFRLIIADTKAILQKMEEGEIDVGFVGAKYETKKIEYKKFLDDIIVMIAPLSFPDTIHIKQLKDYPLIIREQGSGTRNHFESSLKRLKINVFPELQVIAELTDTEAIKEAVKSGMGVSYVSKMAIVHELANNNLKCLNIEGLPNIVRSFYIVTKKGKTISPPIKALLDIVDKWRKHEKR
ncbi:MAG: selenium metabolism-associated LysR family transcriptional regulator [Syntrophorhabdaceae bacterium]|nr:selenium metabolism-associated LysR family transcriptional regulator [Syntrophorhabdaceae bacterium]MDD5244701.1 selenium metabolism-associated LysR family transcriptional regulator [Syntrophorhabdaceae bacterium]